HLFEQVFSIGLGIGFGMGRSQWSGRRQDDPPEYGWDTKTVAHERLGVKEYGLRKRQRRRRLCRLRRASRKVRPTAPAGGLSWATMCNIPIVPPTPDCSFAPAAPGVVGRSAESRRLPDKPGSGPGR